MVGLLQTKMAKTCLLLFSGTFLNKPNNYIHSRDDGKSKNLGGNTIKIKNVIQSHDLKVIAICTGIQQASSTHPCPYCHWAATYIHGKSAKSNQTNQSELRTFGSNRENYRKWMRKGGDKKKAKDYYNCTEMPLIAYEDGDLIIEKFPPPELHIFTGLFNHMYEGMLSDESLSNFAIKWAENVGVSRRNCPSLAFVGDHCAQLLKNVHRLLELSPPRSIHKEGYEFHFHYY